MDRLLAMASRRIPYGLTVLTPTLLFGLCLAACGEPTRTTPDPVAGLETVLEELAGVEEVVGLSLAVVRPGQPTWTYSRGVRNSETGEPVDPGTLFEAASLSKPVFAMAVLRMAERGEIDLDRPLVESLVLDRLSHDPRSDLITPRHVLSHTPGLPNWGGTPLEMIGDPGDRFSYSGEGYVYLQEVVEKLTGESLDEVVRREVFEPLAMKDSSFVWQGDFKGRLAVAHGRDGSPRPMERRKGEEGNAAASLLTTARDYARFLDAVLHGHGLEETTWQEMLMPHSEVLQRRSGEHAPGLYWGLGWGIQVGPGGDAFFHWGDNDGYKAYTMGYPSRGIAFVYFSNSDDGLSIGEELARGFLTEEHAAFSWLGYERHDAPERLARQALHQVFGEQGREAGTTRYGELLAENPDLDGEQVLNRVGYRFLDEERAEAAIAVFDLNVREHPESWNTHDSLAEAFMQASRRDEAVSSYRVSLELNPENDNATGRIAWIEEDRELLSVSFLPEEEQLLLYPGSYGPLEITSSEDGLYLLSTDRQEPYLMLPAGPDLFLVEGYGVYRIRFERSGAGRVTGLTALHASGREMAMSKER